jgi:hypothetical protein
MSTPEVVMVCRRCGHDYAAHVGRTLACGLCACVVYPERDALALAAAADREALYQARITHTRMLPPITLTTGIVS